MNAEDLRRYLSEATGRAVRLRVNANLHSLLSVGRDGTGPGLRVSIHAMFLAAPREVIEALPGFIRGDDGARRVIRRFISENHSAIPEAPVTRPLPRRSPGTARGRFVDLQERANLLHARHFGGGLHFRIQWGKPVRAGRGQRHVTLGTWNAHRALIRIHPMLDHPHVPLLFTDFVIFHEMTHIITPGEVDAAGRLQHHTELFRNRESTYPFFAQAKAWEQRWLPRLITAWNGGAPLPAQAGGGGSATPAGESPQLDLFSS